MAIQIKELLGSDSLSVASDKINYNFDQLILAGGGPEGPRGIQGIQGPNGAQGSRGSQWYVNDVAGTAGTTLPASIFSQDQILDSNGAIWVYGGTSWADTGVNITGPIGPCGQDGDGGEFIRYKGADIGGNWVTDLNGNRAGITDSNNQPNFFGYYDTNDPNLAQGIDSYIIGHNQDITNSTNFGSAADIPKMAILQANPFAGLSIGLGSTYSTQTFTQVIDFNTHAQIFKDLSGALIINGAKGSTGVNSRIAMSANQSSIELAGNNTHIKIGVNTNASGFGDFTHIGASAAVKIIGGSISTTTNTANPSIFVGVDYNPLGNDYTNIDNPGDDILIDAGGDVAINSNVYMTGWLNIKNSTGSGVFNSGYSITTTANINSYITNRDILGTFTVGDLGYESYKISLQSHEGGIQLQKNSIDRVTIGEDVDTGETRQTFGIWNQDGVTSFLGIPGATGFSGEETYMRTRFLKSHGSRPERYTMSGKFRENINSSVIYNEPHMIVATAQNLAAFTGDQNRGLIGLGGEPISWKGNDINDRLNIWGGIRFKGSSLGRDHSNHHYSSVGYHESDMLFYNYHTIDINASNYDVGSPTSRSKIFFGENGLTEPNGAITGFNASGWVNIFNNSDSSNAALTFWSQDSTRNASMGMYHIGSTKHTGSSVGYEFVVDSSINSISLRSRQAVIIKSPTIYLTNEANKRVEVKVHPSTAVDTTLILPTTAGDVDQVLTKTSATQTQWTTAGVPCGGIIMWSGSIANIPDGYTLCDGVTHFNTDPLTQTVLVPDLRERFIVGAGGNNGTVSGGSYAVDATGGANSVTLSISQIPSHTHYTKKSINTAGNSSYPVIASMGTSSVSNAHLTTATGGGGSHENRPPYYALAFIMRLCAKPVGIVDDGGGGAVGLAV